MYYALLIYGVEGVYDRLPEADKEHIMKKHSDLQSALSDAGKLGPVVRLIGTSSAMTVSRQGESLAVTDGPFAETKEALLGLYVVEADTIEEALAYAKRLPAKIGSVEVRPIGWAGGGDVTMGDG